MKNLILAILLFPLIAFGDVYIGEYQISRYYAPEYGQESYYWGSLKKDLAINCGYVHNKLKPENCHTNALGTKPQFGRSVACPSWLLGMCLKIDGYDYYKQCDDTGGSIKGFRLDLFTGYGQEGLNRVLSEDFGKEKGGIRKVWFLDCVELFD